ncbi:A disintegrin and metalloproteinase with thrombospondin motifs like [Oratosquilla oratoria]|uniref:A disintegrin and metalloproteinase with thrombospondin motifs like n=1 Tax=Oratosquilla oratoria TaxID=337810 RepID=UPI003F76CA99
MENVLTTLTGLLLLVTFGLAQVEDDSSHDVIRSRAAVQIRQARSPGEPVEMNVEAFGTTHKLQLLPVDGILAEDFKLLQTRLDNSGNVTLVEDSSVAEEEGSLYHDYATGAVIRLEGDSAEGIINQNLFLQSEDGEHEAVLVNYKGDDFDTPDFVEVSDLGLDRRIPSMGPEGGEPVSSVTAEMHVVMDSTLSKRFKSAKHVRRYLSIFWQAVNHRFATLTDPKVNLVLRGVTIISDPDHEPFITSSTFHDSFISATRTLDGVSAWLFENSGKVGKHDVAYLMTGKNLVGGTPDSMQKGVAGLAHKGGACSVRPGKRHNMNTAIGEDRKGVYVGVFTATHEVAHTFNAGHDSKTLGASCSWDDGYIMSYVQGSKNKFFFSPCSIKAMRAFFQTEGASCLQKKSGKPKVTLSSKLPGDIYSLDEQCRRITGRPEATVAKSAPDDNICMNLVCIYRARIGGGGRSSTFTVKTGHPAAEGSKCLHGGRCIDGTCQE